MLYIAKNGFWVLVGQSANSILSFVLVIAFANLLPKEAFGTYRYILSIAGILNVFTLSGMNAAVSRSVARGNDGVLWQSVRYQLIWNLLMVGAFCVLGIYYILNDNSAYAYSFVFLGLFVPATLAFNTYGAYLEGKKEFKYAQILGFLSTLVYSIGMLVALLLTNSVTWLIAVYGITTFVPSLVFFLRVQKQYAKPPSDATAVLRYGRELTYLRLIDPVVSQIDKVILAHFWGPVQLAVYSLASAIPNRVTLLVKSWITLGFPKFSEKSPSEINRVYWRRIVQGAGIGMGISMVYIIVAPYLFTYLLPQYMEGLLYSQLLSLSFIFALPNRYASLLFASQGMTRVIFTRTVTQNVVVVLLYVILGIWGGLLGLIIANLLNAMLGVIINVTLWLQVTRDA